MSFKNAKIIGKGVNSTDYHKQKAARGTAAYYMSPSNLKEFWRCPRRWVDGFEPKETKTKKYGNMLDCMVLTPDQFRERYAVTPEKYYDEKAGEDKPWHASAGPCKAWKADHEGLEFISTAKHKEAKDAVARLLKDEKIKAFIEASDKQVLVTAEWHDEPTGLIVPVRCLMDFVPRLDTEFMKSLGDMKSSRSAALVAFRRDVHKFGYHIQAAFDTDIYVAATNEDRVNWVLVVQENFAPWQPAKRLLSEDFITLGRNDYRRALALYCQCMKRAYWPDYDDNDEGAQGWSLCSPEPWMQSEGQFDTRYQFPPDEEDDDDDQEGEADERDNDLTP